MAEPVSTTLTAVKIAIELIKPIFTYFKKLASTKKEKDIISEFYKEILLGDKADIYKIKSWIAQLEQMGSTNSESIRARELFSEAKFASHKVVKKAAAKKAFAVRKVATKPVIKKAGPKKKIVK